MTHVLAEGSAVPLLVPTVRASVHWTPGGGSAGIPDLDASVLLLGSAGRVRSEGDFVFYNQPRHPSGLVRRLPKQRDRDGFSDTVELRLTRLDSTVRRVMVAVSADSGPLAAAGSLRLALWDPESSGGAGPLAVFPLTVARPGDTALLCGEVARSGDGWEFRASRRGFARGLAELAAHFGVAAGHPTPAVPDPRRQPAYGYPQPDPAFTLPPQGPQFLPSTVDQSAP